MNTLQAYSLVERLIGRSLAWRLGRWLYQGARRELRNDPSVNGEYALQRAWLAALGAHAAPPGGYRVLDVGANIGDWTVNLFAEARTRGSETSLKVTAFEPAPAQRAEIARRCAPELADGLLTIDPRAVADREGEARFTITGEDTGSSGLAVGEVDGTVSVRLTTVDGLGAEAGIDRLHLVKVDTEGNDLNVILGAMGFFDREAIEILQFEYNWRWIEFGRSLKQVFDFAQGRPYAIGRLTAEGIEIYDAWHPELERYIETNYVLAHRDRLALIPHWRAAFDSSNTAVTI